MPNQSAGTATGKSETATSPPQEPKRGKALLSTILPPLAFCMSLVSLYLSQTAQSNVARIDTLKTEYGLFNDMSHMILEHPIMSHLFTVTPREYAEQARSVRAATASVSPDERSKLILQERAVAHYTFTLYEETFLLWQQAQNGDRQKLELLQADLLFFNDMFCTNPRLAWYWDEKGGGGLARSFGDEVRAYYDKNIVAQCSTDKDPQGPFFGRQVDE